MIDASHHKLSIGKISIPRRMTAIGRPYRLNVGLPNGGNRRRAVGVLTGNVGQEMPHTCRSRHPSEPAQLGGKRSFAAAHQGGWVAPNGGHSLGFDQPQASTTNQPRL